MSIEIIKVGYLEVNCYLLIKNNDVLIIDPGDDSEKIINDIGNRNVVGILLTHHHFDHVGALDKIEKEYNVEIYSASNLEEKEYNINGFIFNVIYNPGHTCDSISFYFRQEKVIFCGDFIFNDNIGRTDLDSGNCKDMMMSIKKILQYDDNIILYPGHGIKTTLGNERTNLIRYIV